MINLTKMSLIYFKMKFVFLGDRYEVELPLKEMHPVLPDNYSLAKRRLSFLLNKSNEDSEVAKKYDDAITEQLKQGIIERVDQSADTGVGEVIYLPHSHVLRLNRGIIKIRVVFNASAKVKGEGPSLNVCLDPGPSLLPLVFDILLRFRLNKVYRGYRESIPQHCNGPTTSRLFGFFR